MKKSATIIFNILIIISTVTFIYANSKNHNLTIEILGINEVKGQISIGLYSNAKSFPKISKVFKGKFIKVIGKKIIYTFNNIPIGNYAIAVFHDVNLNKKLDKNFLGIPKEGYAFSNNKFGMFGPPEFKKVSFKLNENKKISIKLKY